MQQMMDLKSRQQQPSATPQPRQPMTMDQMQQAKQQQPPDKNAWSVRQQPNAWDTFKNAATSFTRAGQEFVGGQLKGAAKTALGIAEVGSKALETGYDATIGKLTGKEALKGSELAKTTREGDFLKAKTGAEKVGEFTEKAGEMLAPIGVEGQIAKYGEGLASTARAIEGATPIVKGLSAVAETGMKAETRGLGAGLEAGGKTFLETGGDTKQATEQAKSVGTLAGVSEMLSPVAKKAFPYIARNLEKVSLRLTPAQERDLGTKVEDVSDYLVTKGVTGTPASRLEKINTIYGDMEDKLQSFLTKDAANVSVPKQSLIDQAEAMKSQYKNERDYKQIKSQIDEFIDLLKTEHPDNIPVADLNTLKRSTYANSYNKAGSKVLDTVEHDLGDAMRQQIESSTAGMEVVPGQSIGDFNKEYGTVINAKKILKTAASKTGVGLMGRVLASMIGGGIGALAGHGIPGAGEVGRAVGFGAAESLAGTPTRSLAGQALEATSKAPIADIVEAGGKVAAGAEIAQQKKRPPKHWK